MEFLKDFWKPTLAAVVVVGFYDHGLLRPLGLDKTKPYPTPMTPPGGYGQAK